MKLDMYLQILKSILWEALFLQFKMLSMQLRNLVAQRVPWRNSDCASIRILRFYSSLPVIIKNSVLAPYQLTSISEFVFHLLFAELCGA